MGITLNADIGEGLTTDQQLLPFLNQANIACGLHAGNLETMRNTVQACVKHGISIGAHPSYNDWENFGRHSINISKNALLELLQQQITQLQTVCDEFNTHIDYVKPHGALYNDMMQNSSLLQTILEAVSSYNRPLALMIGASTNHKQHLQLATTTNTRLIFEAFADRLYTDDGLLTPRNQQHAVLASANTIQQQAQRIIEKQQVISANGKIINIVADSLCLHGDNPASIEAAAIIAGLLRQTL